MRLNRARLYVSHAPVKRYQRERSRESCSSQPSAGHDAGVCEQGGERAPREHTSTWDTSWRLNVHAWKQKNKNSHTSQRHRIRRRVKEARIYVYRIVYVPPTTGKTRQEGGGCAPGAWGLGLEGPATLHGGDHPAQTGWRLHHSLLSQTGGVTDSKHLRHSSRCTCHLNRKIKISFLENEVPSEKMPNQMVASPPKPSSQPSTTAGVRHVS